MKSFIIFHLSRVWLKIRKIIGIKKSKYSYSVLISFLLFLVFIISLLSHVISSAGLNYCGVNDLGDMIFNNSFAFFEKSRTFFKLLTQIPTWLFIKFSTSNSLSALTAVFSFGLIWIHIVSVIGCWLILPKEKKYYIFFPLFAFLVGPLTALSQSVSVSLSVFSYVWFVAFVIYYSDLSLNRHKILFLLAPLPLLLSHELMSYASLFLIFLCLLKRKRETSPINKTIITSLIWFLVVAFFIAVYFILFPASFGNRDRFLSGLLNLKFLHAGRTVYLYIALAFTLILIPFFQIFRSSLLKSLLLFLSGFVLLIFNIILLFPGLYNFLHQILPIYLQSNPTSSNRLWVFSALPLTLFLWFLFEKKILQFKTQKVFLTLCLISSISLLKWRVQTNHNFYKFQKQFSKNLNSHTGIIEDEEVIKNFSFTPKSLSAFFWPYFSVAASIVFPRAYKIEAIVLNSPRADCLTSCKNGQKWEVDYYRFDNNFASEKDRSLYCKRTCVSYENREFDKKISAINTRFFDLTSIKEHFEKQE